MVNIPTAPVASYQEPVVGLPGPVKIPSTYPPRAKRLSLSREPIALQEANNEEADNVETQVREPPV